MPVCRTCCAKPARTSSALIGSPFTPVSVEIPPAPAVGGGEASACGRVVVEASALTY